MSDFQIGDKVVVRLKEYFSAEGSIKPLVMGEIKFISRNSGFAVIDVGGYNVSYWFNEMSLYNDTDFEIVFRNRVKRTALSTSPEGEDGDNQLDDLDRELDDDEFKEDFEESDLDALEELAERELSEELFNADSDDIGSSDDDE